MKTEIKINKRFWAIVRSGDVNGYHTGVKSMETALYEFDTATELYNFLCDGSVESGESMGDYLFNVLTQSPENRILNQLVEDEKNNTIYEDDV